jgi:hypothetical protein
MIVRRMGGQTQPPRRVSEMQTGKSYHMTIDLRGGLRLKDKQLRGVIVDDDGRRLSPDEARDVFVEYLRKGFDVLPVCDHHDDKGKCLGHPVEPKP